MGLSARIFGIFVAFILLFSFVNFSFAQEPNSVPSINQPVINNLHNNAQRATIEAMSAMICQLVGIDVTNPKLSCLGVDRDTGKIGYVKNDGGAIGGIGKLFSLVILPVHTYDFVAYEVNNFGLAKKSYAQGIGFSGLSPIQDLFLTFRNLSYMLFVIIFLIVGVAIMLRVRIDPRTVMTIQNQIPKLIIGLVMITFSYAIAGFLIDMMWVSTYFVIHTLTPVSANNSLQTSVEGYTTEGVPGFVNDLFGGQVGGIGGIAKAGSDSVGQLVHDIFFSPVSQAASSTQPDTTNTDCGFLWIGCIIGGITQTLGNIVYGVIGTLFQFILGIAAFFIFAVAILVQLFKLWFALLKCFINVILGVILAPFWILAGLFPGASPNLGWGGWIRNMLGNLAPFPAVVFLFLVARTIIDRVTLNPDTATNFNPPLLGNVSTSQNAVMYGGLIALGFILSGPTIVEEIRKAFKTGGLGGAGLGGVSTGMAAVGAFAGAVGGRLYYRGRNAQGEIVESGPMARVKQRITRRVANTGVAQATGRVANAAADRTPLLRTFRRWGEQEKANAAKEAANEAEIARNKRIDEQAEAYRRANLPPDKKS